MICGDERTLSSGERLRSSQSYSSMYVLVAAQFHLAGNLKHSNDRSAAGANGKKVNEQHVK